MTALRMTNLFKTLAGRAVAITALAYPLAACSSMHVPGTFDTMQDARISVADGPSYINGFAQALNDQADANGYNGYFEDSGEFTTSRKAFGIGATHALTCVAENMGWTARKTNRPIESMGRWELFRVRGEAMNDCEAMVLTPYHRGRGITTYTPLLKRL